MSTAATGPNHKENKFRVDDKENVHEEKSKVDWGSRRNLNQEAQCLTYMATVTASILLEIMKSLTYLSLFLIHLPTYLSI